MRYTVAIFGECALGRQGELVLLKNLADVSDILGNPTESGRGVHMAIQSALFNYSVLFYKISEEGFATQEYAKGFKLLQNKVGSGPLGAIALPGVGDMHILKEAKLLSDTYNSLIILNEKDLYDVVTERPST